MRAPSRWPVGAWGDPYAGGGQPQKYIVTYAMSANRQRPFAGFLRHGLWNTWRRFNSQVWYWAPPLLFAYWAMSWAEKKYVRFACFWSFGFETPPPPPRLRNARELMR